MITKKTLIVVALCVTPFVPLTLEASDEARQAMTGRADAHENESKIQRQVIDQKSQLPTAQQQLRGTKADNDLTRLARQRLVNDTRLSVASRNVTIVTLNQQMTLQGMVPSQAEKERVVELAQSVSPNLEVIDQMTIAKK